MADSPEDFIRRADVAAAEAKSATLENVRDRALRSEAALRALAARLTSAKLGRI